MARSIRKKIYGVELEAHPVVFPVAAVLIVAFVAFAAAVPRRALLLFDRLQSSIVAHFSWLYIIAMTGFLIFAIVLCCSRFGRIRLSANDEPPEFSMTAWFSMLFSAGMGIGMLFFGVAEPMAHYLSPPTGQPETAEAARLSMGITLFHWCLHPWSLYAVVGLSLAYFGFRKGLPLSFRSVFHPLIGERIHGFLGDLIDIVALLATLFGLATSLGLGAKQVNAGLSHVFGLPTGTGIQLMLIALITTAAVASLVSGLHSGIRRLSEANLCLAAALLMYLFVVGPTGYLLESLVDNVGAYAQRLPDNSYWTADVEGGTSSSWFGSWTVFYWSWWIAWSPFVGMFIARISKGRTIREFILGVLFVPSAVAALWMTGFGGTALHQVLHQDDPDGRSVNAGSTDDDALHEYEVQVLDEATGLPLPADGERRWLVGPDSRDLATPTGVLMHRDGSSFRTKSGVEVEYDDGMLVCCDTGEPFVPDKTSRYDGAYRSRTVELTLAGYLKSPVLNDDGTSLTDTTATAMFVMLEAYPYSTLAAFIGTLSVILFFVTSSDSASLVADMLASGGAENPTTGTRLFWGILEGVLAAVMLVAGGLKALQTGSITIGLPFCILLIAMCVSLYCGLRNDVKSTPPPAHQAD